MAISTNKKSLLVKAVEFAASDDLVGFGVGYPKPEQVFTDENLVIGGWVVGKSSPVETVILSGGIALLTVPVDVSRPDIHEHYGDSINGLCPVLDAVPRCGFFKEIPLDAITVDCPVEVAAVTRDGTKIVLAVFTFSAAETEKTNPVAQQAPSTSSFWQVKKGNKKK